MFVALCVCACVSVWVCLHICVCDKAHTCLGSPTRRINDVSNLNIQQVASCDSLPQSIKTDSYKETSKTQEKKGSKSQTQHINGAASAF